ncbi:MAG: hypothetical protein KDI15_10060 [Thiothrix sp.]|nr:hypothetical protein [Thiothrix sp.]
MEDASKQCPKYDSPAHKFLKKGAMSLSDVEILSLFMGENLELARTALLFNFQSLRELFLADEEDFRVLGISQMSYIQIRAVLELSRRLLDEQLQRGM